VAMNSTFRGRLSTVSASIEGGLLGLICEMAPVVLFFLHRVPADLCNVQAFRLATRERVLSIHEGRNHCADSGQSRSAVRLGAIRLPLR
jgi:hypothetical protein